MSEQTSQTYEDPQHRFSIAYPPEFEIVPSQRSEAGLVLKHKQNRFPTFNIIIQPGPIDISKTPSILGHDILDSYHAVGLTDAKLIDAKRSQLQNTEVFTANVTYTNAGEPFQSSVTIVPGDTLHFILTFIDRAQDFNTHVAVRDLIEGSLNSRYTQSISKQIPSVSTSYTSWILLIILAFFLIYTIVLLVKRHS